jgi:hypothetical protein
MIAAIQGFTFHHSITAIQVMTLGVTWRGIPGMKSSGGAQQAAAQAAVVNRTVCLLYQLLSSGESGTGTTDKG